MLQFGINRLYLWRVSHDELLGSEPCSRLADRWTERQAGMFTPSRGNDGIEVRWDKSGNFETEKGLGTDDLTKFNTRLLGEMVAR